MYTKVAEPEPEPVPEPVVSYEYDDLTIDSFGYSVVGVDGVAVLPSYSYHYVKYTLEDGVRNGESETVYNTSSGNEAAHSFSISNSRSDVSFDTLTGQISCGAATAAGGGYDKLGDVTLKVTVSDKSASRTVEVRQENKEAVESPVLDMDVLFFSKDTHEHFVCDHTMYDIADWPVDEFVPVGIVVIPESHNRYSGKYAGVVALNNATTIQSDPSMTTVVYGNRDASTDYDGIYKPLVDPLEDGIAFLKYNGSDGVVYDSFQGAYDVSDVFYNYPAVGMPSDAYADGSGYSNSLDTETKYSSSLWGAMNGMYCQAPSPYYHTGSSDTYSPLYGGVSGGDNSQCDKFNGEEICWQYLKKMVDITYHYRGWLEDEEIAKVETMMPAMEACWRYAPEGSAEGCWHLPTSAEFAYVVVRAGLINSTISQLNSIYGTSGTAISLESSDTYLTAILAGNASDYHQYAIAHRDHGYTGFEVDADAVCRPMKKVYTGGVTNGFIGYERIPTYPADDGYYCHWGVYRHDDAVGSAWGSGEITGTVYGVRVRSFTDWTVIRDNVPLFSFSGLGTDYYDNAVQFGDYAEDAEPGWYLVKYISLSDGSTVRNINQGLSLDSDWRGITISESSWEGTISTCYKFYGMRDRDEHAGTGLGFDKYDWATNSKMYPFRVGFWNYDTAFVFHPTIPSTVKDNLPWKYCYEGVTVEFQSFERVNVSTSAIGSAARTTMLELAIDLDSTRFVNPDSPHISVYFRGSEWDTTAYIYARGSVTTGGSYESHIYVDLVMEYDNGDEDVVRSWSAISVDGEDDSMAYLADNGVPVVFAIDQSKLGTVGTLKLVMTDFQVARVGDSIYGSKPSVRMSAGSALVTYSTGS